jgi:hypothetical protein
MIDPEKIIAETLELFSKIPKTASKLNSLPTVDADNYRRLHPKSLNRTSIRFDVNEFDLEIQRYSENFDQWGRVHHLDQARYGLALVNLDGVLCKNDPINGSLFELAFHDEENAIIETECKVHTEVLNMSSLKELRVFDGHWCRSNILKWGPGASFMPHIDTSIPSPWIRLWATNKNNLVVRFYNEETKELEEVSDIEPGVVYIIDTSIVHDAYLETGEVYQLFLSVMPSALDILNDIIER